MGDNGEGGGKPCPSTGCQPPLDSKFEVSFAANGSGDQTWYNLSQVDGYTLRSRSRRTAKAPRPAAASAPTAAACRSTAAPATRT